MIEKMKMVYVVSSLSRKKEMLDGLEKLGILHIAEKKGAVHAVTEKFTELSRLTASLAEYLPDKKEQKNRPAKPLLQGEEFEKFYGEVKGAVERKAALEQELSVLHAEIERVSPWGDITSEDLELLKDRKYDLYFYRVPASTYAALAADEERQVIHLKDIKKEVLIASIGTLPPEFAASEFNLPEKGAKELAAAEADCQAGIDKSVETLKEAALHMDSFNAAMLVAQNEANYSSASQTAGSDDRFVWLSGYVPEADVDEFKASAAENGWAYAIESVDADDEKIPTKLKFGKVSGLIEPLYNILGILPGYRESDISMWFLLFFTLFFAMILGDGAYGVLILIGTIGYVAKTKKKNTTTYLLFVLSFATIVWGAITGTWFGLESAMKVPFLKSLVIPSMASYPEYFNVSASTQQNMIMKFSFSVGAIQMCLGSLISVKKKISEKNLSWLADLGWLIAIVSLYMLCLNLVIGEKITMTPVAVGVGVAFAMVVLFGGMSPDKTFGQGLKSGLSDIFTVFLDTISCFGNIMSYIRLFAVGMAGLAISQSFDGIAAGFGGPLVIVGALVFFIGHALNIVMCFLSVVVHGVRLNVLEFSGQVGLEWTGIPYEPFKKNKKVIK